jgi:VCBS repeat-containing protein
MLVGQAENGGTYEYVPQDPAASSMASQLQDGNTPVIVALGGGPLAADFVLAGLPLIAAAGGGFGGLLAGGAALVAAAAAGGGGGGGGNGAGVLPSGQTGNLTHDAANDTGVSISDSYTKNNKPQLTVNAESAATVMVSVNGKEYTATETSTKGVYTVNVTDVLPDGVYTPVIKVTNSVGSSSASGVAFTVDTSSKENQDGGKSPTKIDDDNNIKNTVSVKITSIDDGLTNTLSGDGSKDTGSSKTDFITTDGTLTFTGKVEGFIPNGDVVHVQVLNSANTVIIDRYVTLDSNNAWSINNQVNTLTVGDYTIRASIEDKAGNVVKGPVDQPLTVVDVNTPTLVVRNETVSIVENATLVKAATEGVLINDGDSVAASVTVTKVGTTTANTTVNQNGLTKTTITGAHGQLDMFSDGHYEYRETDDTLAAGVPATDSFTYEVKATGTSRTQTAVLNIDITGVNDAATLQLVNSAPESMNGKTSLSNSADALIITDPDSNEQNIKGIAPGSINQSTNVLTKGVTESIGTMGKLTTTGDGDGTYGFSYETLNGNIISPEVNITKHDLFSFTSADGTKNETLDLMVTGTGAITKQEFNLSPLGTERSIVGLKVTGSTVSSITDVLILHGSTTSGQQTTFDFSDSANTTFTSIEKIELQGNGTNILKLSLADLTQGDTTGNLAQTLKIDGDSNDSLFFKSSIAKVDNGVTSDGLYHSYSFGTDELLVQTTITNITFTS